jgi:choline kinase
MSNHFKVVEEIESLAKKNKKLSLKLKEIVIAFKQQQLSNPFSEHEESEVDTPSLLKRMMNQATSETSKNKKKRPPLQRKRAS